MLCLKIIIYTLKIFVVDLESHFTSPSGIYKTHPLLFMWVVTLCIISTYIENTSNKVIIVSFNHQITQVVLIAFPSFLMFKFHSDFISLLTEELTLTVLLGNKFSQFYFILECSFSRSFLKNIFIEYWKRTFLWTHEKCFATSFWALWFLDIL